MGMTSAITSGLGALTSAGSAINSGVKGARASKQLAEAQAGQDTMYQGMMGQGMDLIQSLMGGYGEFHNPALASQVLGMGQDAAQGIAAAHHGTADALGDRGLAEQAAAIFGGGPGFTNFDFQQPGQLAGQMTEEALAAGARARTGARENLASQTSQFQSGLGQMLADQGMGPQSGAAAAAMSQHALGAGQQMAGLERNIADMAGQAGIQGAQLDAHNLLQLTGMASQHDLGMNQLRGQWGLGSAQGLAGLQGLQDQSIMQQGALRAAAHSDPFNLMHGMYQQSYLQPQLTGMQAMQGIASQLMGGALGGMEAGLDRRAAGAQQAGAGKGSATGSAIGYGQDFGDFFSNKGTGAGGGGGAMPQFGVTFP